MNFNPGWYSSHLRFLPVLTQLQRLQLEALQAQSVIKPDWALRTWPGSRCEACQQKRRWGTKGKVFKCLGWKIENGEAVSVSQRLPSPRHHLLPFADVEVLKSWKQRGGVFSLWSRQQRSAFSHQHLSTNIQINIFLSREMNNGNTAAVRLAWNVGWVNTFDRHTDCQASWGKPRARNQCHKDHNDRNV